MKKLVILGAGAGGTMMANHLVKKLNKKEWSITVIDQERKHYYQAGFLFIPFGIYTAKNVTKQIAQYLPKGIEHLNIRVDLIKPEENKLIFSDGKEFEYDILIAATGCRIIPSEVEGLDGIGWRKDIFDFYTVEGATALAEKLNGWEGGNLVVHLAEMPIKCPVAPLEFVFLVDWFLTKRGKRKNTKLTYVTPLSGAFTKEKTSEILGHMLTDKNIEIVADFAVEKVDPEAKVLHSYDEKTVPYDLLVSIPTNMGDELYEKSGMGDDLNFIPTEKHTLKAKNYENIFVIGDASDLPASKAGSVAHAQSEVLTENILRHIKGEELLQDFDGHANCFIESGFGKGFLIDFNYDVPPVQGTFPVPGIGPFSLLKETRMNHMGKLIMKWMYWNIILKGVKIPFMTSKMSLKGKKL
ncbi:MAG: NAD(P)/FAD-dependent oxidoreductase [Spirochaetales bacterium]|nr:NAD(P)/FAD-dependent oxidoreductase [Spirochaetales bacterium]